ncbi:MAG TPA: hypothetical protein VMM58_02495 [Bacteroidota bacterium]|nr:hypothetical protein [Bacteroidota bacterium]
MSWLFGVLGRDISEATLSRCKAIHDEPLATFAGNRNFYVAAGGLPATCCSSAADTEVGRPPKFWIALGSAFGKIGSQRTRFTKKEWGAVKDEELKNIDGHFLFLRYENGQCECFTDGLGLRTVYWAETPDGVVISSRLDWAAKFSCRQSVDFEKLGSRWIFINQLVYDSPVQGVKRLGPSGRLTVDSNGVTSSFKWFEPTMSPLSGIDEYTHVLMECLNPVIDPRLRMTLGLSGGFDSRLLLSLLLGSGNSEFHTHTFGNSLEPDVRIASAIARSESIRHITLDSPLPPISEVAGLFKNYVAETNLVESVSTMLRLRHYKDIDPERYYVVDGAFAEVGRRQFLKRLALRGRKAIALKDAGAVAQILKVARADIFNSEVNALMNRGVENEIATILDSMPKISDIGFGNYLDLWIVRTRVPNFCCDEQARVDGMIVNYMPFNQPSLIKIIFRIPVEKRKNGNMMRQIITRHRPSLTRHPLIKYDTTYPYSFRNLPAVLFTKTKSMLGYAYKDTSVMQFLDSAKELIFDLLNSRTTKEYGPYDYSKVAAKIKGYYGGNQHLSKEVLWWITFELWRKNIEG